MFTNLDLLALILGGVIFVILMVVILVPHKKFIDRIKSHAAMNEFKAKMIRHTAEVVDNRERVYSSKAGFDLRIDPFQPYFDNNFQSVKTVKVSQYTPKKNYLLFKKIFKIVFIVLFSIFLIGFAFTLTLVLLNIFETGSLNSGNSSASPNLIEFLTHFYWVFIFGYLAIVCLTEALVLHKKISLYQINMPFYVNWVNSIELYNLSQPLVLEM